MIKVPHPDKSEDVECFIVDNDGLSINHVTLRKSGNVIYDDMVNEAYLVVSKPRIVTQGRKTRVGYFLDRDKGITYDLVLSSAGSTETTPITNLGIFEKSFRDRLPLIGGDGTEKQYDLVGVTIEATRDSSILKLFTTPKLLGRILSSEFISRIVDLKPVRWQLIVVGLFAFFLGYAF